MFHVMKISSQEKFSGLRFGRLYPPPFPLFSFLAKKEKELHSTRGALRYVKDLSYIQT